MTYIKYRFSLLAGKSNGASLREICQADSSVSAIQAGLRESYVDYLRHKANPGVLQPIGLASECAEALLKAYNNAAQKNKLDWIKQLRHKHRLSHCPFCGAPSVIALEHYLAKDHYPEFTVLSWNLIPTCTLCNGRRGEYANPPGCTVPMLHPYFDEQFKKVPVLGCIGTIIRDVIFFEPSIDLSSIPAPQRPRVSRQLDKCIQKDQFNNTLGRAWKRAVIEFNDSGHGLQKYLVTKLKAARASSGVNSWDAALYRGIIRDANLCAEMSNYAKWRHNFL